MIIGSSLPTKFQPFGAKSTTTSFSFCPHQLETQDIHTIRPHGSYFPKPQTYYQVFPLPVTDTSNASDEPGTRIQMRRHEWNRPLPTRNKHGNVVTSRKTIYGQSTPRCAYSAQHYCCDLKDSALLSSRHVAPRRMIPSYQITGGSSYIQRFQKALKRIKVSSRTQPMRLEGRRCLIFSP